MRTNNCKKQNEQIPAQANNQFHARAIQSVLKEINETCIKATLFHLDGTESEIVMTVPGYTYSLEAYEDAGRMLMEYINGLTRYWIKIERFQIHIGVVKDGQFEAMFNWYPEEIPPNMLFESGAPGRWITPMEAMGKRHKNESFKKGGSLC